MASNQRLEWSVTDGVARSTRRDYFNVRPPDMSQPLVLESALTCPTCGATTMELMPMDACVYFHECVGCHSLIRPKAGDCCVFCSYGSVRCPPIQRGSSCCSAPAAPSGR
jgi:hypothetical protein